MANISQIKIGSTNYILSIPFVTCSTAASTAAKTASYNGVDLATGTQIRLLLTNGNSHSSPTLALNGGTAKNIIGTGTCLPNYFNTAGAIMNLVYDGTQWIILG